METKKILLVSLNGIMIMALKIQQLMMINIWSKRITWTVLFWKIICSHLGISFGYKKTMVCYL